MGGNIRLIQIGTWGLTGQVLSASKPLDTVLISSARDQGVCSAEFNVAENGSGCPARPPGAQMVQLLLLELNLLLHSVVFKYFSIQIISKIRFL